MNTGAPHLLEALLSILLDVYPQVELLDHMVVLFFLFFEEPPCCFPQQLHHSAFPPGVHTGSSFSTPSSALVIFWGFSTSYPDRSDSITFISSFLPTAILSLILQVLPPGKRMKALSRHRRTRQSLFRQRGGR